MARYRELTIKERYYIEVELKAGTSAQEIADKLGRHHSTIYREIKRGTCTQMCSKTLAFVKVYSCDMGEREVTDNKSKRGVQLKIGSDHKTMNTLDKIVKKESWSPSSALAYALKHDMIDTIISIATFYNYINGGVSSLNHGDLPRRGKIKKRCKHPKQYKTAHRNILAPSIEDRPADVETREEFGHWEADLVVGPLGTKEAILTLVERRTRFIMMKKFPSRHAKNLIKYLNHLERADHELFYKTFKTITFDNDSAFSDWKGIEKSALKKDRQRLNVYFARPYAAWQRASNENANGIVRRKIPKGTKLAPLRKRDVKRVQDWVNAIPRKILDWECAQEAFDREIAALSPPH